MIIHFSDLTFITFIESAGLSQKNKVRSVVGTLMQMSVSLVEGDLMELSESP